MKKFILTVLAFLLVGGTVASAAIPSSDGVIHGCYLTSGPPNARGAVRVIDAEAGQVCASGEVAISWNQAGPTGPTGAAGATGATGPEGPAGPSPIYTVRSATVPGSSQDYVQATATCISDEIAVSGGFVNPGTGFFGFPPTVREARLVGGNPPTAYTVVVAPGSGSTTAEVLCADYTP
jgi:hypothetical protein